MDALNAACQSLEQEENWLKAVENAMRAAEETAGQKANVGRASYTSEQVRKDTFEIARFSDNDTIILANLLYQPRYHLISLLRISLPRILAISKSFRRVSSKSKMIISFQVQSEPDAGAKAVAYWLEALWKAVSK